MTKKRMILLTVLVIAVLGWGAWYLANRGRVSTDDAYVDGRIYTITPRVDGYVVEVPVVDNQPVQKGQVLLRLDPVDYEVALAEARSALASLEEDATAAEQDLRQAQAQYAQAALDLRRNAELLKTKSVSQSSVDVAQTAATSASTRVRAAQAKLDAIKRRAAGAQVAGAAAVVHDSQVEAAKARVKQAALNLEHTEVVAPADGFVTKKAVEAGLMVPRGQPLMALVPMHLPDIWVTANFKETDLTDVRPGQPATIRIDTYPGVHVKGTVESIQSGTGAVFSLFPPENASGNFVKVVQRIPVRIAIDPDQDLPPLRVGMSVVPTIRLVQKKAPAP